MPTPKQYQLLKIRIGQLETENARLQAELAHLQNAADTLAGAKFEIEMENERLRRRLGAAQLGFMASLKAAINGAKRRIQ